jgi:hypothetical protein
MGCARCATRMASRPLSKPVAQRTDLASASVSAAETPGPSTKRAKLIGMLERPEGVMSRAEAGRKRCAIYTRKSSEEGLGG